MGTVASTGSSGSAEQRLAEQRSGSSSPTITVLVNPTDPAATGTWDQAPVNVTITTATVTNALVVPDRRPAGPAGGGYAVEVVELHGRPPSRRRHPGAIRRRRRAGPGDRDSALAAGQQVVVPNL